MLNKVLPLTPEQEVILINITENLLNWYASETGKDLNEVYKGDNDLVILKFLMLFFFVCSKSEFLLSRFEFHALQYGPTCLRVLKATAYGSKRIGDYEFSKRFGIKKINKQY